MSEQFNIESVFEPDDYLYFHEEQLTEQRTAQEAEFIITVLQPTVRQKILDLACGYGRHSIYLASKGYNVTGIDIISEFIDKAQREGVAKSLTVNFVCSDMRQISFTEEFEHAYLLFNSFGYFDSDTNQDILKRLARAVKPGGRVCLDILNGSCAHIVPQPVTLTERTPDIMIDRWKVDKVAGYLSNQRIIYRDGLRKDVPYSVKLYVLDEISELLAKAGFELLHVYGDYQLGQFTADVSRRIICVVQKR